MPLIRITAEAHTAMARFHDEKLDGPWLPAEPNPDGTYDIPVGWITIARLDQCRLESETLSDTILRLCGTVNGAN